MKGGINMAVYGIGACYDKEDVTKYFVDGNCACVGYSEGDAPSLYEMFRRVKIGDIIYIKSYTPIGTLSIKAIGYVIGKDIEDKKFPNNESMGGGRDVIWKQKFIDKSEWIKVDLEAKERKNNVYSNTLYEEYSERIIKMLIDLL